MSSGKYTHLHRRMLLLVGEHTEQHFRTEVAAAHLNLSIEEGRAIAGDLLQIGFIERETVRHQRPVSVGRYLPEGVRVEGPDEHGRYEYVEPTPYCKLTSEGREEVGRLRRGAGGPITMQELHTEVNRLTAENQRLADELRVLGDEDQKLYDENLKLKAHLRRLHQMVKASGDEIVCPACAVTASNRASFCPRCGTKLAGSRRLAHAAERAAVRAG